MRNSAEIEILSLIAQLPPRTAILYSKYYKEEKTDINIAYLFSLFP